MEPNYLYGKEPFNAAIIWSVLPPEQVLSRPDESRGPQWELHRDGRILVVSQDGGRRHLDRLISTDPLDYLSGDFSPGTELP